MALIVNGIQINTIMLGFVENCSLDVGPLSDLVDGQVACVSLGICSILTYGLHHHTGSSGWSPGL